MNSNTFSLIHDSFGTLVLVGEGLKAFNNALGSQGVYTAEWQISNFSDSSQLEGENNSTISGTGSSAPSNSSFSNRLVVISTSLPVNSLYPSSLGQFVSETNTGIDSGNQSQGLASLSSVTKLAIAGTNIGNQIVQQVQNSHPGLAEIVKGTLGHYATWLSFDPHNAPDFNHQVVLVNAAQGVGYSAAFKELSKESDSLGFEHIRYQQQINGIDVENAVYIVHLRNNKLISQNGNWVEQTPANLATQATLNENNALNLALSFVGAKSYKWQSAEEEAFIKAESGDAKATFKPQGELVYYSGAEGLNGSGLRLAYKFDIYAQEPASRQYVYVDALDGKILGKNEIFNTANSLEQAVSNSQLLGINRGSGSLNAIGTAATAYSGTQTITTDKVSNTSYRLRENSSIVEGSKTFTKKIETYNLNQTTRYAQAKDFTDSDNIWNASSSTNPKDQYALDAHFGAEKTYDFYKNNFNRNSIDNAGFALKSYVHYSKNYFNAFWDGTRMTYGDGNASNGNKPLTSLDVCGHEITHGLTEKTANLTYSYESGALNEGFSDIFGTAIEAYARPTNWNWTLGEDFNYVIRDMANPKTYANPDTYKGTYWYSGSGDSGGVHTNSGVLNYWFALLTEGSGSGVMHPTLDIDGTVDTNDKGYKFSVQGLGLDKAQAIAYRTLTTYLVPTSQYADARFYSLQAAKDLQTYKYVASTPTITANDLVQLKYAWNAVGVGGGTSAGYKESFTGTSASETVQGGQLGDILTGVDVAASDRGTNKIDTLIGNGSSLTGLSDADTFCLGDNLGTYYTGGNNADYARLMDFSATTDLLKLNAASTYFMQNALTPSKVELYLGSNTAGDLVGIFENNSLSNFFAGSNTGISFSSSANTPSWATFA
jgi:Zn-dependent metalloprotease